MRTTLGVRTSRILPKCRRMDKIERPTESNLKTILLLFFPVAAVEAFLMSASVMKNLP